jgi:hypothetical protein
MKIAFIRDEYIYGIGDDYAAAKADAARSDYDTDSMTEIEITDEASDVVDSQGGDVLIYGDCVIVRDGLTRRIEVAS